MKSRTRVKKSMRADAGASEVQTKESGSGTHESLLSAIYIYATKASNVFWPPLAAMIVIAISSTFIFFDDVYAEFFEYLGADAAARFVMGDDIGLFVIALIVGSQIFLASTRIVLERSRRFRLGIIGLVAVISALVWADGVVVMIFILPFATGLLLTLPLQLLPQLTDRELELQLKELARFEQSSQRMLGYIQQQRTELRRLREERRTLGDEREGLSKMISADRDVVLSVFASEFSRQKRESRKQLAWGFIVGVLSSICATYLTR
jgi:hypothetical protein